VQAYSYIGSDDKWGNFSQMDALSPTVLCVKSVTVVIKRPDVLVIKFSVLNSVLCMWCIEICIVDDVKICQIVVFC